MNKAKIRTFAIATLGTVAVVASLGAAGTLYVANQQLEKSKAEQTRKSADLTKENGQLAKDKGERDTRIVALERQVQELSPENTSLKESVGAFATQAATCDTLKKTLNIKS